MNRDRRRRSQNPFAVCCRLAGRITQTGLCVAAAAAADAAAAASANFALSPLRLLASGRCSQLWAELDGEESTHRFNLSLSLNPLQWLCGRRNYQY